jgi:hypothetical protein
MASSYPSFSVMTEDGAGVRTPMPLQTVHVRDVTNSADLTDTASDANGIVPGASVTPAAGTLLRFSADLGHGQAGFAEVVTT